MIMFESALKMAKFNKGASRMLSVKILEGVYAVWFRDGDGFCNVLMVGYVLQFRWFM